MPLALNIRANRLSVAPLYTYIKIQPLLCQIYRFYYLSIIINTYLSCYKLYTTEYQKQTNKTPPNHSGSRIFLKALPTKPKCYIVSYKQVQKGILKMNLKLTKPENSDVSISHDSDRSEQPSDTNLEQILSLD